MLIRNYKYVKMRGILVFLHTNWDVQVLTIENSGRAIRACTDETTGMFARRGTAAAGGHIPQADSSTAGSLSPKVNKS